MSTARTAPIALVAGGLYDSVGPEEFWERPGIAPALRTLGYAVHVLDRPARPTSWADEARHLSAALAATGAAPVSLVAASNGCSAALRVALERPELVGALVLCWPAAGDDPEADRADAARLRAAGLTDADVRRLLDGEVVRGIAPDELRAVGQRAVLVPAEPDDARHPRRTVAALRRLLPQAAVGLGTPPSPSPAFAGHLGALVALIDVAV